MFFRGSKFPVWIDTIGMFYFVSVYNHLQYTLSRHKAHSKQKCKLSSNIQQVKYSYDLKFNELKTLKEIEKTLLVITAE